MKEKVYDLMGKYKSRAYKLAIIPALLTSLFTILSVGHDLLYFIALLTSLMVPFLNSVLFLNLVRDDSASLRPVFLIEAKEKGVKYVMTSLFVNFYLILWTMLFIIPGLIKQLSYAMTPFLAKDRTDLGSNKCITLSRELMDGHKIRYFKLQMSYYWKLFVLGAVVSSASIISFASIFGLLFGVELSGLIPIIAISVTAVGSVAFFIIALRLLPRWYLAQVVFYEDLVKSSTVPIFDKKPETD